MADPPLTQALYDAGWFEGRQFDASNWVQSLEAAGFELNDLTLRVWREFGGLRIASSRFRKPPSSLWTVEKTMPPRLTSSRSTHLLPERATGAHSGEHRDRTRSSS
ncbi:SUKH-3 domain-containing protein [Streptomyces scopuliridis]